MKVETFPGVKEAIAEHQKNPTIENHVRLLHEVLKGTMVALCDLAEAVDQIETHLGFTDPESTN